MARAYSSTVVPVGVDEVWRVLRDFDGLPTWHPAIATSEIEDDRRPGEVGCVRRLNLADGAVVREQLISLDDGTRTCVYDIIEGPFPVRSYRAVLRALPVTISSESFVEWYADFDAESVDESSLRHLFSGDVFTNGLNGLRAHLAG